LLFSLKKLEKLKKKKKKNTFLRLKGVGSFPVFYKERGWIVPSIPRRLGLLKDIREVRF
jgi:hypothetical protein